MKTKHESQNTKIWKDTLKILRYVHAETGESMVEILDRLIQAEWDRIQKEQQEKKQ